MYQYDQYDQTLVDERVAQYRDQVRRRLSGELSEEEFRPLRLQNGLYMQRHAYMPTDASTDALKNAVYGLVPRSRRPAGARSGAAWSVPALQRTHDRSLVGIASMHTMCVAS
jgi:sulfite reductase beta subunit-like hemoprotein